MAEIEDVELILVEEENYNGPEGTGILCMDCGAVILAGMFMSPRLKGITDDGHDISDMICLNCVTMGALYVRMSVVYQEPDEGLGS